MEENFEQFIKRELNNALQDEVDKQLKLPACTHDVLGVDNEHHYIYCTGCGRVFSPGDLLEHGYEHDPEDDTYRVHNWKSYGVERESFLDPNWWKHYRTPDGRQRFDDEEDAIEVLGRRVERPQAPTDSGD